MLKLVQEDLNASPFRGEGHRKVWARLHFGKGLRVSRKRVLRIMRENALLSPHRGRQGMPEAHDGTITTAAPDLMWGTDGAKVLTVDEGWVWVFSAVEHWNAECMGWHVTKHGDRFAALEPISQGLTSLYGSLAADVARGLQLRMDHGSQYLSDHFINQVRFWGINPNFAFVRQPETNGVAERFNRTLKEQVIHGQIFRNVEEVRQAVAAFVERYNAEWRVEKNGFVSPREARQNWQAALLQEAA
ncbi:MAG: integrase core domain-containing protein [Desulfuromonadales bacterium]|nr:integrase core domain-containing protein [Desulfuromonadales bacterium]